jgi:molybdate transport system ATP-binding protein
MPDHASLQVRLRQAGPIPLDVELSCQEGELFALVGPSGSGKSTVLRSIAGLYQPQHGMIMSNGAAWLDTEHAIDVPPHLRRVGLVFQSYALFPHKTALGNVAAALGHRPAAERKRRAHELLALVHLTGLEDRRPATLSGGEQQRVAVARALAREPAVLLLDEPFSAVDRRTRRLLHDELAGLRRAVRIPIVLVTHDLDEAATLADRICVLDRGETLQAGAPADVMAHPVSRRVADALDLPCSAGVSGRATKEPLGCSSRTSWAG